MKTFRQGLWIGAIVALSASSGFAQHSQSFQISGDDLVGQPYMLEELGTLIAQKKGGALEVLFAGPAEHRPEAYRDIDLKAGDKLLMANGHKLESIDDLMAALESVEVGDKIKFGVKRGKEVRMVSYAKADPADLPKRKMMMMGGPEGGKEGGKKGGTFTSKVTMDGDGEEVHPLMGSGIIMRATDDAMEVAFMMPHAAKTLGKSADVQEGDRLVSLQGDPCEDAAAMNDQWNSIKAGAEVTITFARGDDQFEVTFTKADQPSGGARMITR